MPKIRVSNQALHVGGNANNSSKAGVFTSNANNTASNVNANIGGRLSLFTEMRDNGFDALASRQNIKQSLIRFGTGQGKIGGEISMKRYGNLWPDIVSRENITSALAASQKGKKHYKEVKMVNADPERYITEIQKMLIDKTFKNSPYTVIQRKEGGKMREIKKLPYYPDRIIHHAIMQILQPIWTKSLIHDTWQSIPGRGVHKGVKRIKEALRDKEGTRYALKMDVKKYYPTIDTAIMKQVIRHKIKDVNVLWLLDEIINSTEGMPIGNYISQIMGNLYLNDYDHRMKELHRLPYYYRYCDDILMLSGDKETLHRVKDDTISYLAETRNLTIKANWQIFPVDARGIDFLGYRFFHDYTLVRKSIAKKFQKAAKRRTTDSYMNSVMSYLGWLQYANSRNLIRSAMTQRVRNKFRSLSSAANVHNPLGAWL
jgi:RNA-directed DNA polymerase